MPYYVKLNFNEDTSFPPLCPYCNKEEFERFREIVQKEYKPPFSKDEVEEKKVKLPICRSCIDRGHRYILFAGIFYLALCSVIVAMFIYPPLTELSWQERSIYLGITLLLYFLTLRFRKGHLKKFRVKFITEDSYTVVTKNKEYAYSLAQRNHTEVVKKWYLMKPL